MLKSVYRLIAVDPGFRPDYLLRLNMSLTESQYPHDAAIRAFWRQLLDGVHALPGVEGAALGTSVPLTDSHDRGDITVEGMSLPAPGSFPHPDDHLVSPGYRRTLGIRLLAGLEAGDRRELRRLLGKLRDSLVDKDGKEKNGDNGRRLNGA